MRNAKKMVKGKVGAVKPVDHRAYCIQSTMYMLFMAMVVFALVPRFTSRYLGMGDPLQRASRIYQQGNQFYEKGNLVQAEKHYREAVQLNPRHAFALTNLVSLLVGVSDSSLL